MMNEFYIVWMDGTICHEDELDEFDFMSDDYILVDVEKLTDDYILTEVD